MGERALVLASGSPRRAALLAQLEVPFTVRVADVDESPLIGELPEVLAVRLASEKARAVAATADGDAVVIGGDTVVALHDRLLGKPVDDAEAREMLRALSGRPHTVWTGIAVVRAMSGACETAVVPSIVRFRVLTEAEIEAYVGTGEGRDKAGAYAVQGIGGGLVAEVVGCWNAVIGLPLCATARLLRAAGVTLAAAEPVCTRPDGSACPRSGRS